MDLFLDILYFLGVFIVPWLVLYGIVRWFYPRRVIIYEYERGLKYNRGHYDKTLKPGVHFHNAAQKIVKVDVREQVLTLRGAGSFDSRWHPGAHLRRHWFSDRNARPGNQ